MFKKSSVKGRGLCISFFVKQGVSLLQKGLIDSRGFKSVLNHPPKMPVIFRRVKSMSVNLILITLGKI